MRVNQENIKIVLNNLEILKFQLSLPEVICRKQEYNITTIWKAET